LQITDVCEAFEPLIGELVDGTLDGAPRHDLEAHLASCPSCARLVEELLVVRRAARGLAEMTPPADALGRLTAAIAAEPRPGAARGRAKWLVGLAAAAVLALAVAGAALWQPAARPAPSVARVDPATATSAELLGSVEAEFAQAEKHLETAVAGLEVLAKDRQALDPTVAADLQKSLHVIDQAIGESRAALKTQPLSTEAQESLFEAFRSKIALLQDTISLINEVRKGNQAEAARIADGMNKL
jgi:anti-sigma factor RsiW